MRTHDAADDPLASYQDDPVDHMEPGRSLFWLCRALEIFRKPINPRLNPCARLIKKPAFRR